MIIMERNLIVKHSCWDTGIFRNRPSFTLRNCLFFPDHYRHQQGHNFYCSSEKFSAARAVRALFGSWGREIAVSGWRQTACMRVTNARGYEEMLNAKMFVEVCRTTEAKESSLIWGKGERRKGNEMGWKGHLSGMNLAIPQLEQTMLLLQGWRN